jgi:hypothetical protein
MQAGSPLQSLAKRRCGSFDGYVYVSGYESDLIVATINGSYVDRSSLIATPETSYTTFTLCEIGARISVKNSQSGEKVLDNHNKKCKDRR